MNKYYLSRAVLSAALALLLAGFGLIWWGALLSGLVVFAAFVLLARSGRYVVRPEGGITAMQRDEMSQQINRQAGLNGFVALILAVGALTVYYGVIAHSNVPVGLLEAVLLLGLAIYFLTDYRLRRM